MQLALVAHGIEDRTRLADLAARRADHALGRFADRIGRVVLRLRDVNGPKGGISRQVLAEVHLVGGGLVVVRDMSDRWEAAISLALERAGGSLRRAVGRLRWRR